MRNRWLADGRDRSTATPSTRAPGGPGPAPARHAVDRRLRALELGLDRAVGPVAHEAADARGLRLSRHVSRNHTPCTRPVTTDADADRRGSVTPDTPRSRTSSGSRSGPGGRPAAARARLALAVVHLVMVLVLAGLAEQVDVLLVGERRAAVLHRVLQRLEDRAVQAADLLLRERVALRSHFSPAWNRISSL